LSKLKLFFVENLKKYDIDPKQSSKTHHENIIKALIAFEIKKYYRRFSEKYSLNEKQLDLFQEELINEIINSQRQKIKNLKINQEIFEKIKDFAKKEKIEKLQQIDRSEVKDLFRFVQRFGADTGRKINFSADIYDYKKFLKYLRDIIGQKFTDFKDIFFSQILKKDSLSEFSSIDPNDWNVIFFSFFLNFLINSFQLAVENESHRGRQNFIVLKEKEQLEKFLNDEKIISRELMKVDFINKNEGIYVQDIKS